MPTVDQLRQRGTIRSTTVTSTVDGRDHLISQQATAAGLVTGDGQYVTICGRLIVAAPLVVPPGPTCLDCETALHRITTADITSHRRRGLLTRLLRRRHPRAGSRTTTGGNHRAVPACKDRGTVRDKGGNDKGGNDKGGNDKGGNDKGGNDKGGNKHIDKQQDKRDTDGQRPIKPDTVREPKPGKRGK